MQSNFEFCLNQILKHEGGFVNHPMDGGRATNKGVTIATFRRYVKPNGTIADLKAISHEQVATVYRRHYWDAVRASELPSGVDLAMFDNAVNAGPSRAVRQLQECIGAVSDGRIGPATLRATASMNAATLIDRLCDRRLRFLRSIRGGSLWVTFGKGWQRRVDDVRQTAKNMTAGYQA